ncbi:MAG TPA: glutaredoxin 3 [Polyangia bacterium]
MASEVRIYTTTYCGYCRAAKALLAQRGAAFREIDCTDDAATRQWLVERTGQRTVPQIFIGDVPVGGFSELSGLDRAGRLSAILAGDAAPPSVL